MYVNNACIINERHTHLKISVGTVQLGQEAWVNKEQLYISAPKEV